MNVTKSQVKNILISLLKLNPEQAETWLDTPTKEFSLKKPKELIEEGHGSEVIALITKTLPNGRPNKIKN